MIEVFECPVQKRRCLEPAANSVLLSACNQGKTDDQGGDRLNEGVSAAETATTATGRSADSKGGLAGRWRLRLIANGGNTDDFCLLDIVEKDNAYMA